MLLIKLGDLYPRILHKAFRALQTCGLTGLGYTLPTIPSGEFDANHSEQGTTESTH